jgi:uroporphyrinogen-III synthase
VRVLVTRPEPGASRTAAKLRAMGFEPVVLPLSETGPLAVPRDPIPENAAAVAVTSANAIRHAPPDLMDRLTALPCRAVGRRTADAARAAGFGQVEEGPGDAAGLAERIGGEFAGKVLVHLCGRERFPGFEERLAAAGVQVRPIETYDTVAMDYSDDAVLSRLSDQPPDALLLYSAKAADAARKLAARPVLQSLFRRARVYALSERIAAAYRPIPSGGGIRVAPTPTEEALLALLARAG